MSVLSAQTPVASGMHEVSTNHRKCVLANKWPGVIIK